MTKDDIIKMALEAGFGNYTYEAQSMFERFAHLVAAAEREACALVCESRQTPGTGSVAILSGAAAAIRERSQS